MKARTPDNPVTHPKPKTKHSWMPKNENEEKERFMKYRLAPNFTYDNSVSISKYYTAKKMGYIHFDLFYEARSILDRISKKFGSFDQFIEQSLGKLLSLEQVKRRVERYLEERKLTEIISISYVKNISCSAKLNSLGFSRSHNKPEARKYILLINIRKDNVFLREFGIDCLLDHEIGTHFVRAFNEGLQPWYWNRLRFGLSSISQYESKQFEEGLAAINTVLGARQKLLGSSAMLYYATCMAHFLTFGQLYDHLEKYIESPDIRWRHCVRIKRSLKNVDDVGGYAKDQCYFEGAVYILANVKHVNFGLLYCGKVTVKDLARIQKVARLGVCHLPSFMSSIDKYRHELVSVAKLNGIYVIPACAQHPKPANGKLLKLPPLNKPDSCCRQLMGIKTYLKWKKPSHRSTNQNRGKNSNNNNNNDDDDDEDDDGNVGNDGDDGDDGDEILENDLINVANSDMPDVRL